MSIVIPRSVWKPRYANGFAIIGVAEWLAAGKEIWLHHSVTDPPGPDATLEQDCAHMREFEAIGQSRFGGGISYTWVVMPSGRVFEGHSLDRQGSHTYMRNDRSRAICLAGKYHLNALPQRMQDSVAQLLRELDATIDGPHSAVYATDCPGEYARSRIPAMNALALSGTPIGEADMTGEEHEQLDQVFKAVAERGAPNNLPQIQRHVNFMVDTIMTKLSAIESRVAKLEVSGVPATVDNAAIARAVVEEFKKAGN